MGTIYKHIEAIARKDTATLVGVTTTVNYHKISLEQYKKMQNKVKLHEEVVIIPIEYSVEHFNEGDLKIASFCEYNSLKEDKEKSLENSFEIAVGYSCKQRCRIENIALENDKLFVDIELIENQTFKEENENLRKNIYERFKEYLKYDDVNLKTVEKIKHLANSDISSTAFDEFGYPLEEFIKEIAIATKFDVSAKRKLLEEENATKRLEILNSELETRIYEQSSEKGNDIFNYYKTKINQLGLSADTKKLVYAELTRLKSTRAGQAEYSNIIDWLDRVIALPWNKIREENTDIDYARKMLNETHYGMDKLKQKILDYIALKMISGKTPSTILCLYGPPGVGKSTIVKSIAKALNKDYYGFSLGGVTNPEEINGMKRFYIGAKPGRILEGVTQAGSKNCIILLDEIDKMASSGTKGDPYAVLLDVLDKNQNLEFKDKYFDIPFDLSEVMFIATANELSTIPEPVRNRLDILTIDGYSINEKVHIAKEFIIKKVLKEIGVAEDIVTIDDKTLQMLIEKYTFESGVRQLERLLTEICKKYLIELELNKKPITKAKININQAQKYIDKDYFEEDYNIALEGEIGVINKMSVMGPVGEISRLEISLVKGTGEQILSDNLVGTAKWTFKTVFGLVKSKASSWDINEEVFTKNNFYIHSPHHAISHDGPSGGVADVLCLISAIKEIPINHKTAFTGEISLKGKVLAIGGVKEKLLAAQRSGMETVVVPLSNKKDVEKLSNEIVGDMKIKYVDNIDEAYEFVFEKLNEKGEK